MPLADADVFWKPPNVYDITGIAGFVVGVASIWFAWWLARRDIQRRLNEAADRAAATARGEVRRVARAVIHTGVADAVRWLELAREACGGKRWVRAVELCILAREQLARVLAQPAADDVVRAELRDVSSVLQEAILGLRAQPRTGTGEIPPGVLHGLDESIIVFRTAEGRMTGIQAEMDHGQ